MPRLRRDLPLMGGSLVSYEDMERLYENEGATLIREPWGRPYDETVGPEPGAKGILFPDGGVSAAPVL